MSNKWEGRLKKGLRGILRKELTIHQASSKFGINQRTYKYYIAYLGLEKASEVHFVEKIVTGAVSYLIIKSQLTSHHVLNSLDYQLTFETWRTKFFDLKKRECEVHGVPHPNNPPVITQSEIFFKS